MKRIACVIAAGLILFAILFLTSAGTAQETPTPEPTPMPEYHEGGLGCYDVQGNGEVQIWDHYYPAQWIAYGQFNRVFGVTLALTTEEEWEQNELDRAAGKPLSHPGDSTTGAIFYDNAWFPDYTMYGAFSESAFDQWPGYTGEFYVDVYYGNGNQRSNGDYRIGWCEFEVAD